MEIYVDVLLLENIFVNFLILKTAGLFISDKQSFLKLFLSSFIGSVYVVVVVVFPGIEVLESFYGKILLSLLMTAVAYSPKDLKKMIKCLIAFYITTFVYAGAGYAFVSAFKQKIMFSNKGIFIPVDGSSLLIALGLMVALLFIRAFMDLFKQRLIKGNYIVSIIIGVRGKQAAINALIDTGNCLYDPITMSPVIIVELSALKDLLPEVVSKWIISGSYSEQDYLDTKLSDSEWQKRIRIIPYRALGNENGILFGFKPDTIKIQKENLIQEVKNAVIGIYNNSLSFDNNYKAIVGPDILNI